MTRVRRLGALAGLLFWSVAPGLLRAQDSCAASRGVSYRELPDAGAAARDGRILGATGGVLYGVDIDSRIEITFDTTCLRTYLDRVASSGGSDSTATALAARLDSLQAAVKAISPTHDALQGLFKAFAASESSTVATAAFVESRRSVARSLRSITLPLQHAIAARLVAAGQDPAQAASQSKDLIEPIYAGGETLGYNWTALGGLLGGEIKIIQAQLDSLAADVSYQLEVRAWLIGHGGSRQAIALPGHNEEVEGPAASFERFQFALSPSEQSVFDRADSLSKTIGGARSFADAVRLSLNIQIAGLREELQKLASSAEQALQPLQAQTVQLLRWTDTARVRTWLESVARDLARDPAGVQAIARWQAVDSSIVDARADLEALRQFAALQRDLENAPADAALTAVARRVAAVRQLARGSDQSSGTFALRALKVSVWQERIARVDSLLQAIKRLGGPLQARVNAAGGPVADVKALAETFRQATVALQQVAESAIDLLAQVLALPPVDLAGALPEPKGQRRVALGAGLDTRIELKTISAPRYENDQVSIEYRFFKGEKRLPAGWTDRFRLRVFGWRSRVTAGLAFALREHTEIWRPGAAVSWMFSHRGWPHGTDRGTGDALGLGTVAIGLTAMNLHFDQEESVELGIGPAVSFLDNRIIVGGGWNLQVSHDHLYGFMVLRLLNLASTGGG